MKIKSLKFDGFHFDDTRKYDLGDISYLYGRNGAGKSSILEAIQLCILGYIPGTAKTVGEIFAHSCKRHMDLELILDDNGNEIKICRYFTAKGSTATSTVEIEPSTFDITSIISDIKLPIFDFNSFLELTANRMKDWFLSFLPKQNTDFSWEDVLKTGTNYEIPDSLLSKTIDYLNSFEKTIDGVKQANQYFKEFVKGKKDLIQTYQSTISSLIKYDDVEVSMTEEELKEAIAEIDKTLTTWSSIQAKIDHNTKIKNQLSMIVINADSIEDDDEYRQYKEEIEKLDEERVKLLDSRTALNEEVAKIQGATIDCERKLAAGDGTCPYTQLPCNEVKSVVENAEKELEILKEEFKAARQRGFEISEKLTEISDKLDELNSKINKIEVNYDKYKLLSTQLVEVPEDVVEVDVDFLKSQKEGYTDTLVKLEANKKYDNMIDSITSQVANLENELAIYKDWEKATSVNGLQTLLATTASPFLVLEDEMNVAIKEVFGENCSAKFNVSTKANSFSFGLERNDDYIKYDLLSSGEKCIYMISLLISILRISNTDLKLLLIDDAFDHLDDINIKRVFEMLKKFEDVQMVFAGVKAIDGNYVINI